MAITGFKEGHYYRWIGPRNYCEDWTSEMEPWKDGNARKFTASDGLRAEFDGIEGYWYYGHCLQHFEDVAYSAVEISKELTEREKLERIAAESTTSITIPYLGSFGGGLTSTGVCFTITTIPQTLVEKRRATRRRLLGL